MTLTGSAMPLTRAGKIIPLLIFADKRAPKYPNVPTPGELGYDMPILASYTGIVGPPGMDREAANVIVAAFKKTLVKKDVIAWAEKMEFPILPLYGDEAEKVAKKVMSFYIKMMPTLEKYLK